MDMRLACDVTMRGPSITFVDGGEIIPEYGSRVLIYDRESGKDREYSILENPSPEISSLLSAFKGEMDREMAKCPNQDTYWRVFYLHYKGIYAQLEKEGYECK